MHPRDSFLSVSHIIYQALIVTGGDMCDTFIYFNSQLSLCFWWLVHFFCLLQSPSLYTYHLLLSNSDSRHWLSTITPAVSALPHGWQQYVSDQNIMSLFCSRRDRSISITRARGSGDLHDTVENNADLLSRSKSLSTTINTCVYCLVGKHRATYVPVTQCIPRSYVF